MADKTATTKRISLTNTKQEMLDAYNVLLKQFEDKNKTELKPEEELAKKKTKEALDVSDTLTAEGIIRGTANLRLEVAQTLTQLSDRLQDEVSKYRKVKEAIEIKEQELRDIYGIERAAQTLVALIEAQTKQREEFESEMAKEKETLDQEIDKLRSAHEKEKQEYEETLKTHDAEETKRRQREKEEYEYAFKRQQQLARDSSDDEKVRKEKEFQAKREALEKSFLERERKITDEEAKIKELSRRVENFPKEMEAVVQRVTKETSEKILLDARNREELLKKTYEGEKNVFVAQVDSLEKIAKEQKEQILRLSQQLEKAYQKIEDIAVKTVGGVAEVKSLVAAIKTEEQAKKS